MKEIIIALFQEFGFFTAEADQPAMFFQKQGKEKIEYYLVMFLDKVGLEQYTLETLNDIQQLLMSKKEAASDIDKNTSLLICVEFDDYLTDCQRYKNIMLQIEEDEYAYKKYLLPFTAKALDMFSTDNPVFEQLNDLVADDTRFSQFSRNIYAEEAYFFAVQTFLKLPFLNLVISRDKQFVTIEQLLSRKISATELNFMNGNLIVYPMGNISRDQLLADIVDPRNDSFTNFFNTFDSNDPTS